MTCLCNESLGRKRSVDTTSITTQLPSISKRSKVRWEEVNIEPITATNLRTYNRPDSNELVLQTLVIDVRMHNQGTQEGSDINTTPKICSQPNSSAKSKLVNNDRMTVESLHYYHRLHHILRASQYTRRMSQCRTKEAVIRWTQGCMIGWRQLWYFKVSTVQRKQPEPHGSSKTLRNSTTEQNLRVHGNHGPQQSFSVSRSHLGAYNTAY